MTGVTMIPSESGKKDILFFGVTKEYMSFLFCLGGQPVIIKHSLFLIKSRRFHHFPLIQ